MISSSKTLITPTNGEQDENYLEGETGAGSGALVDVDDDGTLIDT
jgi:hypothetical protein